MTPLRAAIDGWLDRQAERWLLRLPVNKPVLSLDDVGALRAVENKNENDCRPGGGSGSGPRQAA